MNQSPIQNHSKLSPAQLENTDNLHNLPNSDIKSAFSGRDGETLIYENSHYDPRCDTSKLVVQADLLLVDNPIEETFEEHEQSHKNLKILNNIVNSPARLSNVNLESGIKYESQNSHSAHLETTSEKKKIERYRQYLENDAQNTLILSRKSHNSKNSSNNKFAHHKPPSVNLNNSYESQT
jgi:hypothetical protein